MTTLLLVEYNELNRDMQARRLERKGFEVLIAVDGWQGVEVATEKLPDLILMDLNLPFLNGWEATRRLKGAPETRKIPIIALTAHATSDDREKAMEAGCDEYLSKPINQERLREVVCSLGRSAKEGPTRSEAGATTPPAFRVR